MLSNQGRPMHAASAQADGAVTFEVEDTSADGEPTRMVVHLEEPAVRAAWSRGLAAPRARERAYNANPLCVECGTRVRRLKEAGLLSTPDGLRVAHKVPCFLKQMEKLSPTFSRRAAVARVEGR